MDQFVDGSIGARYDTQGVPTRCNFGRPEGLVPPLERLIASPGVYRSASWAQSAVSKMNQAGQNLPPAAAGAGNDQYR